MAYIVPVVVASGSVAAVLLLIRRTRGKSLALLGPRKSGKTTLATFLQTGEIPRGYKPTIMRSTVKARRKVPGTGRKLLLGIKMRDVALKLTILDNPGVTPLGDKTNYGIWQDSATKVDAVCYLVDVSKLSNKKYRDMAINGVRHIARWDLHEGRKFLILTHTDLDSAWERGDRDEISGRAAVKDLRRELQAEEVIMGTLKDDDGRRDLTYLLLQLLAR